MYKVRFNLGKGSNFMKWKIENLNTKEIKYIDPALQSLKMEKCLLKNNEKLAKKIWEGSNKRVCAWIECHKVDILPPIDFKGESIKYNPKHSPYWRNKIDKNIDNNVFSVLITNNKNIFEYDK